VAESTAVITRKGCERIIRFAFEYALTHQRRKVTMVHKANILKTGGSLWLDTGREIAAVYAGRVAFEDRIIDNTAMQLVVRPEQFDVLVTANMFGDILSDEMAGLVGGLGLAASANVGAGAAIFEAVQGTAPDIAGQGVVNPSALILAGAMMLEHIGETDAGCRVREAVTRAIRDDGVRTRDLGGTAGTSAFTEHLVTLLRRN
jgi:isocitrate dehydrogenase (NAD+)